VPVDFVRREVDVTLSEGESPAPVSFRLGAKEHKIEEQLATWQDHSFAGMQRGRDRPGPRQRTFYRVRTAAGEIYELYADWQPSRRRKEGAHTRWYLHRRLTAPTEEEAPPPAAPPIEREPVAEAEPPAAPDA
jgi:hypothetical protein